MNSPTEIKIFKISSWVAPCRQMLIPQAFLAHDGLTESTMLAHGFTAEILASLVRDGLATAVSETLRADDRTIKEERIKITDAGLRALEG